MGKVKFSSSVAEIRNKVGGQVYARNRYGAYVRNYAEPLTSPSSSQTAQRNRFKAAVNGWAALTSTQRLAWSNAAASISRSDIFSSQYYSTGFNFFVRVNTERQLLSLSNLTSPPSFASIKRFSGLSVNLDPNTGICTLSLSSNSLTSAYALVIRATGSLTQSTNFFNNKYRVIKVLTSAASMPYNAYSDYITSFTAFQSNKRVAFEIYAIHIASGIRSQALHTYSDTSTLYDSSALAYFAQLSSQPSTTMKGYYNSLFISLKAGSNNFSKLDRLWIWASEIESNSWVSLINPTATNALKVSTPAWVQYQGYTGAANKYIDLRYNPSTNGVQYTRDLASVGVYLRNNTSSSNVSIGSVDDSFWGLALQARAGTTSSSYINSSTAKNSTIADSLALITNLRTASNSVSIYKRGSLLTATANTSVPLLSQNIFALCVNFDGVNSFNDTRQQSLCFIGGNVNVSELYTSLQAFMTSLGTQV